MRESDRFIRVGPSNTPNKGSTVTLMLAIVAVIVSLALCISHIILIGWLSHHGVSGQATVEKIDRGFLYAGAIISVVGMLIPAIPPLQSIPAASIVVGGSAFCLAVPCRSLIAYFLYRWCGPLFTIVGIAAFVAGYLLYDDGQKLPGLAFIASSLLLFGSGLHLTNKILYQNRAL